MVSNIHILLSRPFIDIFAYKSNDGYTQNNVFVIGQ